MLEVSLLFCVLGVRFVDFGLVGLICGYIVMFDCGFSGDVR